MTKTLAVQQNTRMNVVASRTQLYETETKLTAQEKEDSTSVLCSLFMEVEPTVSADEHVRRCMSAITADPVVIRAATAAELNKAIWSDAAFDSKRSSELRKVRMLYLHAEDYLYHLHNAFDFMEERIIHEEEWKTWRGVLEDCGTHPVMLGVIRDGWERRYFSREFGEEMLNMLLPDKPGDSTLEPDRIAHNRVVIGKFFPEMLDKKAFVAALYSYKDEQAK